MTAITIPIIPPVLSSPTPFVPPSNLPVGIAPTGKLIGTLS